jgi:hypothetical protein
VTTIPLHMTWTIAGTVDDPYHPGAITAAAVHPPWVVDAERRHGLSDRRWAATAWARSGTLRLPRLGLDRVGSRRIEKVQWDRLDRQPGRPVDELGCSAPTQEGR